MQIATVEPRVLLSGVAPEFSQSAYEFTMTAGMLNTSNGWAWLGNVSATDPDGGEMPILSVSFSTNSAPHVQGNFDVQWMGSSGTISFNNGWATLVGSETITGSMTVTDGDGNSDTADLILNIVNHAPQFSSDVYEFEIGEAELLASGGYLEFGSGITMTDADWDQTWGGSSGSNFFSAGGQGVVYSNGNNLPITPGLHTFTVGVTDIAGGFDIATVNVNVVAANDPPVIDNVDGDEDVDHRIESDGDGEFKLAYNTPVGTFIGRVHATDNQDGDSYWEDHNLTFSLTAGGDKFAIDWRTGRVTLTGPVTASSYTLTVRVTDQGGLFAEATYTLNTFNAITANPGLQGNTVGLYANTNASERNTGGRGYNNTFEVTVVRFVAEAQRGTSLTVQLEAIYGTATADDVTGIPSSVTFGAPTETDILRGYQLVTFNVSVVNDNNGAETSESFQIKIKEDPSYTIVGAGEDNAIRLQGENRRYARDDATFTIYEDGPVIACLPNDDTSKDSGNLYHDNDILQYVGDCYFISSMIAAVRLHPELISGMITEVAGGYQITFPGDPAHPITLTGDLDRGEDSVKVSAADQKLDGRREIWPLLLEQAYAVYRATYEFPGEVPPGQEYERVGNGVAANAYFTLTGHAVTDYDPSGKTPQQVINDITAQRNAGKQVMMATGEKPADWDVEKNGEWSGNHIYVVEGFEPLPDGKTKITLRNPLPDPARGNTTSVIWEVRPWINNNINGFRICD